MPCLICLKEEIQNIMNNPYEMSKQPAENPQVSTGMKALLLVFGIILIATTLRAPISTEVTRGSRSAQASAIRARD